MADFRTELQAGAAGAFLEVAKQLGAALTVTLRSGTTISVYGLPQDSRVTGSLIPGVSTDERTYVFTVPKQTGFPPTSDNWHIGATVTYNSLVWPVESVDSDSVNSHFKIACRTHGLEAPYGIARS